jgi:hypothetical protein
MHIPWRTVAIGSMLFNLGAIGTVATVATVRGSDALATVALALAIIAFICQLIVFSVQTWQSGEQLKQAERLNSETHGLMGEIRTRLESTHQMVATQYRELLHLTALKSEARLVKTGEPGQGSQANISADRLVSVTDAAVEASPRRATDTRYLREALKWPAPIDVRKSLELLMPLPNSSVTALALNAGIDALARALHQDTDAVYGPQDQQLVEAGLATKVVDALQEERVQVTEKGRLGARLLLAEWPPPKEVSDITEEIWRLRESAGPRAAEIASMIRGQLETSVER